MNNQQIELENSLVVHEVTVRCVL